MQKMIFSTLMLIATSFISNQILASENLVSYRCASDSSNSDSVVVNLQWTGLSSHLPKDNCVSIQYFEILPNANGDVPLVLKQYNLMFKSNTRVPTLEGAFGESKMFRFFWYFDESQQLSNGRIYISDLNDPYFEKNETLKCFQTSN